MGPKKQVLSSLEAAGCSLIQDLQLLYYLVNIIRGFQHFDGEFQESLHEVLNFKIN